MGFVLLRKYAILMPMKPLLKSEFGMGGIFERTLPATMKSSSPTHLHEIKSHEYWMKHAIHLAMNAVGWSAPNPSVGCVIVKDNQVLAEGFTQAYRHEHAERIAFQALMKNVYPVGFLKEATVYVTLEPCAHFGSQPPCVDLLIDSEISHVVIACLDPDSRVNGKGIEQLKQAGKKVTVGVLENEARAWHFPFLKNRILEKPIWIAKWAENENGYLADAHGNSKWITQAKSRAYSHWLRQKYDAVLVGAQTWIQDQPQLTVRDCDLPHRRDPIRLIFDPKGKIRSLAPQALPTYFFVGNDAEIGPEVENVTRVVIPAGSQSPDLISAFREAVEGLKLERPIQTIFCEGGPTLLNLLFQEDVFEAVHRFQGSKIFTETNAKQQVTFLKSSDQALMAKWSLVSEHYFDDDCLQEWAKWF